jgi:hypothetical protein
MSLRRIPVTMCLMLLAPALLSSCALWRGGPGSPERGPGDTETRVGATTDRAQLESRLRDLVAQRVQHLESSAQGGEGGLVYRNPFWLREYVEYPRGTADIQIEIRETQSQTSPFVGTARLDKRRFATKMYRRQDEALADNNYLRDTGVEVLTYEFRHGRWVRIGALFTAEVTERRDGGTWIQVEPEVRAEMTPPRAPEGGFISRTWSRLLGR